VGWLDGLAQLKKFYTGQLRSQGNPQGRLTAALTASLPGVDTSQPGKGIHVYLAGRLQLIKARCSALSKTCAAIIEKTVLPFSMPIEIPNICETAFAVVEVSGQFLTTKKLSDGFCQGPGTQKLIECRGAAFPLDRTQEKAIMI